MHLGDAIWSVVVHLKPVTIVSNRACLCKCIANELLETSVQKVQSARQVVERGDVESGKGRRGSTHHKWRGGGGGQASKDQAPHTARVPESSWTT